MASSPFDASLRARVFRRPSEAAPGPADGGLDRVSVSLRPRQHDFARALEAALQRELGAGEGKADAGGERRAAPGQLPNERDDTPAADSPATAARAGAAPTPVSCAVQSFDGGPASPNELHDELSAREIARRYAPRPADAIADRSAGKAAMLSEGGPASSDAAVADAAVSATEAGGGSIRRPGRQTADAIRVGPFPRRQPRPAKPASRAAGFALVLIGVAGGFGTILGLELLAAPRAASDSAAMAPIAGNASHDRTAGSGVGRTAEKAITVVALASASANDPVSIDDRGKAPVERGALPPSGAGPAAETPTAAPAASPMKDPPPAAADDAATPKPQAAPGAAPPPDSPVETAEGAAPQVSADGADPLPKPASVPMASDPPAAAPGNAGAASPDEAEAGAGGAAAPPEVRSGRPARGGAPVRSALAYAPAAAPVDRAARAILGKAKNRPTAKASRPGPARIVAWVNWVNMRASPDDKTESLATLPAGSAVTVVACSAWCEVSAGGKRGFILRRLLSANGTGVKAAIPARLRRPAGSATGNPFLKS